MGVNQHLLSYRQKIKHKIHLKLKNMKTSNLAKLLTIVLITTVSSQGAFSQCTGGIYGLTASPVNMFKKNAAPGELGLGVGMSFLSYGLLPTENFNLNLGFNFEYAAFHSKEFKNVLMDDQVGMAKVKVRNSTMGINFIARMVFHESLPLNCVPFAEVFAGGRFFGADEIITPNAVSKNYENKTSTNLLSSFAPSYGISAGCMFAFFSSVHMEAAISYSKGETAQYLDLATLEVSNNTLQYKTTNTTTDMLMFKLGIFSPLVRAEGGRSCETSTYPVSNNNNSGNKNTIRNEEVTPKIKVY